VHRSTGYGGDYDQQDAPVIDGFQDPVSPEAPVSSANSYYGAPQPPATDQQEPVDTVESDDPTDSDPTDSVDPVAPHFDCSSKKNGIFVHPTGSCAKSFWSCGNGQGFEYQCPEGLFYNADNNRMHLTPLFSLKHVNNNSRNL
jgi:hypothetical protein